MMSLSLTVALLLTSSFHGVPQDAPLKAPLAKSASPDKSSQAFKTGLYRNLFREIGKSDAEIVAKVNGAWNQLFYGRDADQRVYYPVGEDMAYIKDVGSNDVRSEGMSYGMMISVQLGRKAEFDRLWKWAKVNMQNASGPYKGYFGWQADPNGKKRTHIPASDGEEYFAMALYFADGRWGSGLGIYNYRAEADEILRTMLHKVEDNGGNVDNATNMFDPKVKQVVFVPSGDAAKFTDASYHLPAFYELWARWAKTDRPFWAEAAKVSRAYLKKAVHPKTGLPSDYSSFEGAPMKAPWDPRSSGDVFASDSLRVAGNIAMDYAWFGVDPWQVTQTDRYLGFLAAQKPDYVSGYSVDGIPRVNYRSTGHVAMNAAATLASTLPGRMKFVQDLWNAQVPSGQWRYYDGMLYMFGLLHASGQYRIWSPKK